MLELKPSPELKSIGREAVKEGTPNLLEPTSGVNVSEKFASIAPHQTVDHAPMLPSCPEAILISELLEDRIDVSLGYHGKDRYVLFYYEPRGQEIMWRDRRSYGFGIGGWKTYQQQLAQLARAYRVNIGDDCAHGCYALLLDRRMRLAYFLPRHSAEAIVRDQEE